MLKRHTLLTNLWHVYYLLIQYHDDAIVNYDRLGRTRGLDILLETRH